MKTRSSTAFGLAGRRAPTVRYAAVKPSILPAMTAALVVAWACSDGAVPADRAGDLDGASAAEGFDAAPDGAGQHGEGSSDGGDDESADAGEDGGADPSDRGTDEQSDGGSDADGDDDDDGGGAEMDGGTTLPPRGATLQQNRDRLLDDYAARHAQTRCEAWGALSASQQGVFLTLTDLLGRRTIHLHDDGAGDDTALDHVLRIEAIRGTDTSCWYIRCCGGGEFNRLFFTVDEELIADLRVSGPALPAWAPTRDLAGPHKPFTQSVETLHGQPRGQAHFFARDEQAVPLSRPGVENLADPRLVEIDVDYNLVHESAPDCSYRHEGTFKSGRLFYEAVWREQGLGGSAELDYAPSACD